MPKISNKNKRKSRKRGLVLRLFGAVLILSLIVPWVLNMSNDFSTTPQNPPRFIELGPDEGYDTSDLKAHEAYPELEPLFFKLPSSLVFAAASDIADQKWRIIVSDGATQRIEAVAITPVLRFRDDIAIEVREEPNKTVGVHIRSRSRLGKWDLGVNAKRIKEYLDELNSVLSERAE